MERGMSQTQLADAAGVSQPTISAYENNPRTAHRAQILFKIAAALEVSPEYLESGRGHENLRDLQSRTRELVTAISALDEDQVAVLLSVVRTMTK